MCRLHLALKATPLVDVRKGRAMMNRRRFVGALAARLNDQSVFGGSVEDAFLCQCRLTKAPRCLERKSVDRCVVEFVRNAFHHNGDSAGRYVDLLRGAFPKKGWENVS